MGERTLAILGWIASATAIAMYMSYLDQIRLSLDGQKGSLIQPVNYSLWVSHGFLREKRDWRSRSPTVRASSWVLSPS
ncbi:MAG: hypothetical protein QM688_07670 [Sphingomonas bacterium]